VRVNEALDLISRELKRAETKHPAWPEGRLRQAAIVAEEAGEVLRAALNIVEFEEKIVGEIERYRDSKFDITLDYNCLERMEEELIAEVVQTGAMAMRFLLNYRPLYAKVQGAQAKPEA